MFISSSVLLMMDWVSASRSSTENSLISSVSVALVTPLMEAVSPSTEETVLNESLGGSNVDS